MTLLLIEKKIGCHQSKLATPSRNQVVETEERLWQESIHFQRWVECTCMFWKRRNLVTWLCCPDIGSCLISSSTNRYVVDRFGITITRLGNECMLLYLASSERDDVLIPSETIPVLYLLRQHWTMCLGQNTHHPQKPLDTSPHEFKILLHITQTLISVNLQFVVL